MCVTPAEKHKNYRCVWTFNVRVRYIHFILLHFILRCATELIFKRLSHTGRKLISHVISFSCLTLTLPSYSVSFSFPATTDKTYRAYKFGAA